MTKERIILAFVAIIAGLIVASSTFFFYNEKGPSSSPNDSPTPTEIPNGKTALSIESPQNESVTDKNTAQIKGKANPGSLIVITTDTEDFAFMTDEDGSFEEKVSLSKNENILTVSAYPENQMSETEEIIVTYTTEEF